jgi:hypothetical protein
MSGFINNSDSITDMDIRDDGYKKRPRVEPGTGNESPLRKRLPNRVSRQPTMRGPYAADNVFNIGSSSSRMAANDTMMLSPPRQQGKNIIDPETPENNPDLVERRSKMRQYTTGRDSIHEGAKINRVLGLTSPETRYKLNRYTTNANRLQIVANTIETYIRNNFPGEFAKYIDKKTRLSKKLTDEPANLEEIIRDIDIIIEDKVTNPDDILANRININLKTNGKLNNIPDTDKLNILFYLYDYYVRSEETQQSLNTLSKSSYIGSDKLEGQRKNMNTQRWKQFLPEGEGEDDDDPMNTSFSQYDTEKQDTDKAKQLKNELIEIINSNLQNNLQPNSDNNYELDPENVNYLKDGVKRNEAIIMELMEESDDQTTITRDVDILKQQPSELAKLASSLGEKYISLNLKGGPKVTIDGIGDSSVVETDDTNDYVDSVIIGTKYVEKYTEETDEQKEEKEEEMKKEEDELIVEQTTARGVDKPKRSSRLAEASEKLKEIEEQLKQQQQKDLAENEKKIKKMKKNVKKKESYFKNSGQRVDGPSAILSVSGISSIASNLILEFLKDNSELKITIHDLIAGNTPHGASPIYSDLLYEACLLRNLPSQLQYIELERVKPVDAREAAATGIAEKTQFADIWGPWVFNYASGQSERNREDGSQPVKCYICKQNLVPFSIKVDWGSKGKRTCSEMEHTLPCITAFTQAPTYVLLDRYKHKYDGKDVGYLKLWKKFTEDEYGLDDDPDSIYKNMKELYQMINEYDEFNKPVIEQKLENLMTKFKNYCLTFGAVDDRTFNWVIEVIKYWLFEFSYAHHICNQVKSNRDIEQSNEMTRYLNDTENRWRGSPDKKGKRLGQDNIDIAEATSIDESRNITLNKGKIKKNLKSRFDMMREYSGTKGKTQTQGTIRQNYKNITSIKPEELDKDKHDIMSIMVTKGLILMYKHYKKEQLKKDKKASSSKNPKQSKITEYTSSNRPGSSSSSSSNRPGPLPSSVFDRLHKKSTKSSEMKQRKRRGGTIKRKQNKRKQRTIKRKDKKNRKQRTIKRKQNKRKQRTIKKQKK